MLEEDSTMDSDGDTEADHLNVEGSAKRKTERRMKKDDSGISVEKSESDEKSDDDTLRKKGESSGLQFKLASQAQGDNELMDGGLENCNAEKAASSSVTGSVQECGQMDDLEELLRVFNPEDNQGDGNSPDSGHFAAPSAPESSDLDNEGVTTRRATRRRVSSTRAAEDSGDSDCDEDLNSEPKFSSDSSDDESAIPEVLLKEQPRHNWFVLPEVRDRQLGCSSKYQSNDLFRLRMYSSLHVVQRLELMYKLEKHEGCVNALHFNAGGDLLASSSDDRTIVVWNWAFNKALFSYDSGHRSNVFQSKFLPFQGNTHIVSCARDGQVRLAELSSTGICKSTRRLTQHKGPAHKIAIQEDTPHCFISVGEDAVIYQLDVRETKQDKLLTVLENERKVALYSVHSNPINSYEFCVSGRDPYVRIYDKRKISDASDSVKRFCPKTLQSTSSLHPNVTCAVYNYNGTEVLGSYNDEDIYLFNTLDGEETDFIHRFQGHRNTATVKGVNFFGPKSEYVVSGSDCGNIFFWDKEQESIVQFIKGDENGVVNVLEPHPCSPILATSGLDDDVKIWVPSCEDPPTLNRLKHTVMLNSHEREKDRLQGPEDTFDGRMLWDLWRHFRRAEHRSQGSRRPRTEGVEGGNDGSDDSSWEDDSETDSDEEPRAAVQCPTS